MFQGCQLGPAGTSPIDVAGPGVIELNDRGSFDYSLHISAEDYSRLWQNQFQHFPTPGSIIPAADFFTVTAASYEHGVWTGRVTNLLCGGNFGGPGIAYGDVHELQSSRQSPDSELDYAVFYLPGRLSFPPLHTSKIERTRGNAVVSFKLSRDYSEFSVAEERFRLLHEDSHTEIECTLAKDGIAKNRHLRMQEALTYSLSQFIWPSAIETSSGGRKQIVLKASDVKSPKPNGNAAPLTWGGSLPMSEVYEMAKACYLKLLAFEQEDPPSVSKAIFALVQATSGFIEYQILGLSTATESLIRAAFPELGAVEEEIKQEVQKFRETISELPYSCRFKNRLNGAASAMLNPDNASAIRTFIEKHGLGLDILKAWQDIRRSSAHGGQIPYERLDEVWEKRSKVLSLCHSIVLAFIGYSGKRTNYHQKGYPQGQWPPKNSSRR